MTIHPSIKSGDRVRVTVESTVVRCTDNTAHIDGTPAWTNLAFAEHTAEFRGDPGPSYFTLELPHSVPGTTVEIKHVDELLEIPAANAAYQVRQAALDQAIATAKSVADRDKYSPQESAAAWDVVDALVKLQTAGEHVTPDPTQDDRDGKAYSRAAEYVTEGLDDCD